MSEHVGASHAFAVVFLTADQNTDESAFTRAFASHHGDLDVDLNAFDLVSPDFQLANLALDALHHRVYHYLGVQVASHEKQSY